MGEKGSIRAGVVERTEKIGPPGNAGVNGINESVIAVAERTSGGRTWGRDARGSGVRASGENRRRWKSSEAVYRRRFNRLAMAVNCEYDGLSNAGITVSPNSDQVQEDDPWRRHTPTGQPYCN